MQRTRPQRPLIVLTGGPGGGKTTLIQELQCTPDWNERVVALPEAISVTGGIGISPHQRLFQRLMVELQAALEEALDRALGQDDPRVILCHRGMLDPLAYWLHRGWSEQEFFAFTRTCREDLYQRYTAVLHFVTAADGAAEYYRRWPHAHRPESPAEAIQIDCWLRHVWSGHPRYFRLDNSGRSWSEKSMAAKMIIANLLR